MKKFMAILLVTMCVFSLVACRDEKNEINEQIEKIEETLCKSCGVDNASHRESADAYYCDSCYKEFKKSAYTCKICKKDADRVSGLEELYGDLCTDCYTKSQECWGCGSKDFEAYEGYEYMDYQVLGYYCSDCYNAILESYDHFCGDTDSYEYREILGYYCCDDCYLAETVCINCNDSSKKASARNKYYYLYCDDCYGDGNLKACSNCNKLVEKTVLYEEYPADEVEYFCLPCYALATVCYNCHDRSRSVSHIDDLDGYYCKACYGNDQCYQCYECKKLVKKDSHNSYASFELCQECYEKNKLCWCCDSKNTKLYNKGVYGYYCDDCFEEVSSCIYCGSKGTTYREELEFYYCDKCYVKGGNMCTYCAKLVEYDLIEITEEDFACKECASDE